MFLFVLITISDCNHQRDSANWPEENRPFAAPEEAGLYVGRLERIRKGLQTGGYGFVDRFLLIQERDRPAGWDRHPTW